MISGDMLVTAGVGIATFLAGFFLNRPKVQKLVTIASEVGDLIKTSTAALQDGKVTKEEIDTIFAEGKEIVAAVSELTTKVS